jgi:hypothetical protein
MVTSRLLYVGYGKSANITKPHDPSNAITERHTQNTHENGSSDYLPISRLIGGTSLSSFDIRGLTIADI